VTTVDLIVAAFGWTPEREAAFADQAAAGLVPGRVVSTGGVMRAMTPGGQVDVVFQRRFKRAAASAAELPAVGDWLALEPMVSSGTAAQQAALTKVLRSGGVFLAGTPDQVEKKKVARPRRRRGEAVDMDWSDE